MSAPARARPTPPSSTPGSTPRRGRSRRDSSRAGMSSCGPTHRQSASRSRRSAPCWSPGTTSRPPAYPTWPTRPPPTATRRPRSLTGQPSTSWSRPSDLAPPAGCSCRTSTSSTPGPRRWRSPRRPSSTASDLRRSSPVVAVRPGREVHELETPAGSIRARFVVNAAGLRGDELHRRFGHDSFTVTPRRGELIVFDKLARGLVGRTILPVPDADDEGGPGRADGLRQRHVGPDGRRCRRQGGDGLHGRRDRPPAGAGSAHRPGTAGRGGDRRLRRAARGHRASRLRDRAARRPAVPVPRRHPVDGAHGVDGHRRGGGRAARARRSGANREGSRRNPIGPRPEPGRGLPHRVRGRRSHRVPLRARDRSRDRRACAGPVPATDLDGVRRRTRALTGRCQGFACSAAVIELVVGTTGGPAAGLVGLP